MTLLSANRLVSVLGTHLVANTFQNATKERLRIVAYHGVENSAAFEVHLDYLAARFSVVSASDVAGAVAGASELPANAIWLTFDDGWANVVDVALPLLLQRGLTATMFVCPGVIEGDGVHWWQRVDQALTLGWGIPGVTAAASRTHLKTVSDEERRRHTADAATWAAERSAPALRYSVANEAEIRRWLAAGMEVGNHTWDHPCMDRCTSDEQRSQVLRAHEWLVRLGGEEAVSVFAYPNGDWAEDTEEQIRNLGYKLGLIFDHRVNSVPPAHPLRLSRLRLDSDAPANRMRAIVSGAHSSAFAVARKRHRPDRAAATMKRHEQRRGRERPITIYTESLHHPHVARTSEALRGVRPDLQFLSWPSHRRALITGRRDALLHLQWISVVRRRSAVSALVGSVKIVGFLALLRLLRVPIVWTIHNPVGKSTDRVMADRLLRTLIVALCRRCVVLNEGAIDQVRAEVLGPFRQQLINRLRVVPMPMRLADHGAVRR